MRICLSPSGTMSPATARFCSRSPPIRGAPLKTSPRNSAIPALPWRWRPGYPVPPGRTTAGRQRRGTQLAALAEPRREGEHIVDLDGAVLAGDLRPGRVARAPAPLAEAAGGGETLFQLGPPLLAGGPPPR